MEAQQAPAAKQPKGIKKLWLKVKASMISKSKSKSTEGSTVNPAPNPATTAVKSQPPPVAQPPAAEPILASAQIPQAEPATKSEAKRDAEETKATKGPTMLLDVIEIDNDDSEERYDMFSAPQHAANQRRYQLPPIRTVAAMSLDKHATALRYRRAQEVFEKYNLTLDPSDWQLPNNSGVDRVEKKPRMRVRYTCHQCKQTFGREKKCSNCSHMRCDVCIRYPPKRTGDEDKKMRKPMTDMPTLVTPTSGACHECKTSFDIGAAECGNCRHKICSRCLMETVIASPATAPPAARVANIASAS